MSPMLARMPQPPPGWLSDTGGEIVSVPARTVPVVAHLLASWTLVVVAWLLLIVGALVTLRAILAEDLDSQDDQRPDPTSHD